MNTLPTTLLLGAALAFLPATAFAKGKPVAQPSADPVVVQACAISDFQATTACSGYYAGNLNGGSADKIADSQFALAAIGFTWDGNLQKIEKIESFTGRSVAFSQALKGVNFISIHYGAGQGPVRGPGGSTGFYRVDAGAGLAQLQTLYGSLSNAILYTPGEGVGFGAVPEPAVWAQLIAGFGLVGLARRRRGRAVSA